MLASSCHWAPREHKYVCCVELNMSCCLKTGGWKSNTCGDCCFGIRVCIMQEVVSLDHTLVAFLMSAAAHRLNAWTHCSAWAATSGCFQYMVFLIVARRCGLHCDVVLGTATAGWWHPTKQNPRLRERLFVVTCSSHVTCFFMLAHCRLRLLFTTQRRREASTASKQGHYTFQL